MNPWEPELTVTPDLATRLIESQFPALKPIRIQSVGAGWDNIVYSVNEHWYFRFPQRKMAVEGVEREMAVLPLLSKMMDGIPGIDFKGIPSADYPWAFFGYRPLLGEEPARLDLQDRSGLAVSVAQFLKALHSPETATKLNGILPEDQYGRLDFNKQIPRTEDRLEKLTVVVPNSRLREILNAARSTESLPCRSVVHGDLHFRHIITSPAGQFQGLIDWGDMHLNDPAVDLHLYWSFFSGKERGIFLNSYGPLGEVQKIQSRSFAVFINVALLTAALDQKQDFIIHEALRSLDRILED